jgi:stage III sporulation protein AF
VIGGIILITFLSSWVKNLSLAIIIVSILEMLLPNNKIKKYVKTVMGLYILFSIISPFIENGDNLEIDNIDVSSLIENSNEISTSEKIDQSSMDIRLNQIYVEELQKDIITKIEEKGYNVEKCKVEAEISQNENDSGIKKITVKIKNKKDDSETETESIEDKLVTEIQKIQKVEISASEKEQEESNITNTDTSIIKKFLIEEYEVNENCLKIS